MTPPAKCPRCGARRVSSDAFACGSGPHFNQDGFYESWDCAIKQRDALAVRVKELEEAVIMLSAYGNQLNDELYPPPRNCSCHICAPCADCEQWESQRVAKADWDSAIKRASKAKESKP